MNAAVELARVLPRHALCRLLRTGRVSAAAPDEVLGQRLGRRYAGDLAGLLNRARRDELEAMAGAAGIEAAGTVGELRARLWVWGAEREAGGDQLLGSGVQPMPILLRGKLVHLGPVHGRAPASAWYPREVPAAVPAPAPEGEPGTLEELLEAADRLIGVRLGAEVRDKGAFGARVAALLGVAERGFAEPDWRGEVEIKSVPVVRDRGGWWYVKEDPAVSMETAAPLAKLRRVLWVARVADDGDSPILSWYYQEWDQAVAAWVDRRLHTRPKGGAGATTRGWYLHKRFFVDNGLLRTLNG